MRHRAITIISTFRRRRRAASFEALPLLADQPAYVEFADPCTDNTDVNNTLTTRLTLPMVEGSFR